MASDVQIANMALVKMGHKPIQSFIDESDEALAVNAVYDICRDDVLAAHPWNFATKRASLAELALTLDTDEWTHFFQLPTDGLRVLYVEPRGTRYEVEHTRILTNAAAPLKISYIARITDAGTFSVNFVNALVYRLAMELVVPLTARDGYGKDFAAMYLTALREAKSTDALEGISLLEDDNPLGDVRRFNVTDGPDHSGWPWW